MFLYRLQYSIFYNDDDATLLFSDKSIRKIKFYVVKSTALLS